MVKMGFLLFLGVFGRELNFWGDRGVRLLEEESSRSQVSGFLCVGKCKILLTPL